MADKDEAQVLADAAKLPLDERVGHSNWKVRSAAYDAIKAGCNSVFNSEDPVLGEYGECSYCWFESSCCCCCWLVEQLLFVAVERVQWPHETGQQHAIPVFSVTTTTQLTHRTCKQHLTTTSAPSLL